MVPKRTNFGFWFTLVLHSQLHNTKPKIDVEKFIMFIAHTIYLYLLCASVYFVCKLAQIVRKGATTMDILAICTKRIEKSANGQFLCMQFGVHSAFFSFFRLCHDEVKVLLLFCGVIVCDIVFHGFISLVTIFLYSWANTLSSQKWRNAIRKVKLWMNDESEMHSLGQWWKS